MNHESLKDFEGTIEISVKTRAPKTEIRKIEDNKIYLDVKAQPEKGKANLEIIRFFSKITKKNVRILSGGKSKKKIIRIAKTTNI